MTNVDCFVEIDDFVLIGDVWVHHKLSGHVLLIFFKFSQLVGVHEEDSSHVPGISDHPLSIDTDFLDRFPTAPSGIDADVQAANHLCLLVVRFKGIVSGEDFVKIDISVKEDIIPL